METGTVLELPETESAGVHGHRHSWSRRGKTGDFNRCEVLRRGSQTDNQYGAGMSVMREGISNMGIPTAHMPFVKLTYVGFVAFAPQDTSSLKQMKAKGKVGKCLL